MARKKSVTKNQMMKSRFPLTGDINYERLSDEEKRFVYFLWVQPLSGLKNYEVYCNAYGKEIDVDCRMAVALKMYHRIIKRPHVAQLIDLLDKYRLGELHLTAEKIILEEMNIAFFDPADIVDARGNHNVCWIEKRRQHCGCAWQPVAPA